MGESGKSGKSGKREKRVKVGNGKVYKAAVADCGCHDNRMDKIWWNEQWMGWPVGPHYAEQSNVTMAPRLQGKLLLMVGEMDRNVLDRMTAPLEHMLRNAVAHGLEMPADLEPDQHAALVASIQAIPSHFAGFRSHGAA